MTEEHEPCIAGELAERSDGRLGATFDRLGGGENRGVSIGGQFRDPIEHPADADHLGAGQRLRQRTLHLAIGIANQKNSLVRQ